MGVWGRGVAGQHLVSMKLLNQSLSLLNFHSMRAETARLPSTWSNDWHTVLDTYFD